MLPETIKVAIADDEGLFVRGMKLMIEKFKNIDVVIEAEHGKDLIEKMENQKPDVILMDLLMPEMDGFEATAYIHSHYPQIKVIALTRVREKNVILRLFDLGINGFLSKNAEPGEVEDAIRSVMQKGYYSNNYHTKVLFEDYEKNKKTLSGSTDVKLSELEIKALRLISWEYTTKEIAEKMFKSPKTIEGYRNNLLRKTGAKNIAGLVMYALVNNIVDFDLGKKYVW